MAEPVFFIVVLFIVAALVGGFLFHFTRKAPLSVADYFWVSTSILVCCVPIALLPADVSSALTGQDVAEREMWKSAWVSMFWLIQIYSWVIIPIHQSYVTAGGFSFLHKLRLSIVENVILYAAMAVLCVIGLIVILVVKKGITQDEILGMCIALSNGQGLLQVLILLGYGLVAIPKACWRHSNRDRERERLEYVACGLADDKDEAELVLHETAREIEQLTKGSLTDMPAYYSRTKNNKVVKLNATYLKTQVTVRKATAQWERLVAAYQVEHTRTYRWSYRLAAIFLAIVSIILLWSECSLAFEDRQLSIVYQLVHYSPAALSFLVLLFVCCVGYATLLRVRIFSLYEIIPHVSDTNSLQFFSLFLSRVIIPICNNAAEMMGVEGTAFQEVFDVAVLGSRQFNAFVPAILLPLVIGSLFDAWARLAECLGIAGRFEQGSKDKTKEEDVQTGRTLLQSAVRNIRRRQELGMDPQPKDDRRSSMMSMFSSVSSFFSSSRHDPDGGRPNTSRSVDQEMDAKQRRESAPSAFPPVAAGAAASAASSRSQTKPDYGHDDDDDFKIDLNLSDDEDAGHGSSSRASAAAWYSQKATSSSPVPSRRSTLAAPPTSSSASSSTKQPAPSSSSSGAASASRAADNRPMISAAPAAGGAGRGAKSDIERRRLLNMFDDDDA